MKESHDSSRARRRTVAGLLLLLSMTLSCMDRDVMGTRPPEPEAEPGTSLTAITCSVAVASHAVTCEPASAGTLLSLRSQKGVLRSASAASSALSEGVIVGGQNQFVSLASSNITTNGSIFAVDVTVTNLIGQTMGTSDGTTLAPEGVRVFFAQEPAVTAGSGTVALANDDGSDFFTASDQPFFQYDEMLDTNETSPARTWQFAYTGTPTFNFIVYVWAPVQYPDGWVDITPPSPTLDLGVSATPTQQLTPDVVDVIGRSVTPQPAVTWGSSDTDVASVDGDGIVTGVASGTATITATAGAITGTALVTVMQDADVTTSTVIAADASIVADGIASTTITVQLNDALGNPLTESAGEVTLASSGAGTLGGVTDVGNGSYTATLTSPTTPGSTTIAAELDNVAITDTETVTYTAGPPENFLMGAPPGEQAPGSTITISAQARDVNDNLVQQAGILVDWTTTAGTFGGESTAQTATDSDGIAEVSFTLSATGGTDHTVTATLSSDATVDGIIVVTRTNAAPAAVDQERDALGNVQLSGTGLLTGATDLDHDAGALVIEAEASKPTTAGGTVVINADGTFTYHAAVGFTGEDTFTFTVVDPEGAEDEGTATITVGDVYWFVDASYAGGDGNGTQAKPFTTIAAAATAAAASQTLLVFEGSYAGVTLKNGLTLHGQSGTAVSRIVNGTEIELLPTGSAPTLAGTVALGVGNTLTSLGLNPTSGHALTGTNFGTLTVAAVSINAAAGAAMSLNTGTINGAFGNVSATNDAGDAFSITGVGGTWTMIGGSLTGTVYVSGGSTNLTIPQTIAKSGAGRMISVESRSGGTLTFSGNLTCSAACTGILAQNNTTGTPAIAFTGGTKSLSTGANAAVTLTTNTGGAISFTGGGLAITTTSGAGFTATGGGTVQVTGSNNTVNTTAGGTAVNIQATTIGVSGVSFRSINAIGGGSSGIVLNGTGAGAFEVIGNGASDANNTTRGRIGAASGSGGTISGKSGNGISLTGTGPVTLRNMVVQNNSGHGIEAATVAGLTLDNSRITGHAQRSGLLGTAVNNLTVIHSELVSNATSDAGGVVTANDHMNMRMVSATGTASVRHSLLQTGAEHIARFISTTGTLNLTVENNTFSGAAAGDGFDVFAWGNSNVTANVQGNTFANNSAFGMDSGTETTQSATLNLTVNNNVFSANFVGVTVAHGSSGTNTFNVTNNNFQNHGSISVNINRLGGGAFTSFGLFSGTVSGNTIGTAGAANSGSAAGSPIRVVTNGNGGTSRVAILNNTIREYAEHGITVVPRDATSGHTLHARIQGNTITNPHAFALDGVNVTMGALNTDVISLCLDIGGSGGANGNTVGSSPRNGIRVRSSGLPAANVTLTAPAYDGTGATYFANRNPAATGASGNASFSNGSGTTTAGACVTP